MMDYLKRIYNLVKVDIKTSKLGTKSKKETKWSKIGKYFLIILLVGYCAVIGYQLSEGFLGELVKLGEMGFERYFIGIIVMIAYIFIILSATRALITTQDKDHTESYLDKLPIESKDRYISKNISNIIYSYSGILMFLLIPIIYLGVKQNMGIGYYLRTFFAFLLMPVLPTLIFFAIFSFIKKVLDIITNNKSEKITNIFNIVLVFYIYYLIYYKFNAEGGNASVIINLIAASESKWYMYLPNIFINIIMGNNVFVNILKVLGINIFVFFVLVNTIGRFYGAKYRNKIFITPKENKVNVEDENKNKNSLKENKKINVEYKNFKVRTAQQAYIKREFSTLMSNIMLAFNTLLVPVFLPIFMLAIMGFMGASEMKTFKDQKDKIYLISNINLSRVESLKDAKDDKEFKEQIANTLNYRFVTNNELEKKRKRKASDDKAKLNIALEMLNNKIQKAENEEEKKQLEIAKKQIENQTKEDADDFTIIGEYSFADLDKNEEKIFNDLKEKQKEGKINYITEEEKAEQLKDEDIKKYAKHEMPSGLLTAYQDTKDLIESDNIFEFAKLLIMKARKSINIKEMPNSVKYFMPIVIGVFLIYSTSISIFMVSKDKNEIQYLKTIPVDISKQIMYKEIPGILTVSIATLIYILIPDLILGLGLFKDIYVLLGIITTIVFAIGINNLEIILDLYKPNFEWKDINGLVKGGPRVFFMFIAKMIIIAIGIIGAVVLVGKHKMKAEHYAYILTAVIFAFTAISTYILKTKGSRLFKKL